MSRRSIVSGLVAVASSLSSTAALSLLLLPAPSLAVDASSTAPNLADLSLEELSEIQVTTASKRAESLSDAPASIFVITSEDIRRSGMTSLPQALSLAPNLEVAQVNANNWAISARGFQNLVTNKLLVLIDGRTVYSPILSGVFWNAQAVMLEDVERIEVISGPGAALSGGNAVDGVINIITKSAKDTTGGVVTANGSGSSANIAMRYGAPISDSGAWRLYAMHDDFFSTDRPQGTNSNDRMIRDQVGFRADMGAESSALFTIQGDAYESRIGTVAGALGEYDGANLVSRVTKSYSDGSRLMFQAYLDTTEQNDPLSFHDLLETADVEGQYDLAPIGANSISLGGGYRYSWDRTYNTVASRFIPAHRILTWANLFIQDEYAISPKLKVTLGAKIETDIYTSPQLMPDLRLAYKPVSEDLIWTSLSHAVREPARVDRDFYFPGNPPYLIRGDTTFQSEVADVFELGYRAQPSSAISYSVTAYYNRLDRLRSGTLAPGGGFDLENDMSGSGSGVEAWGSYQATANLRLSAGLLEIRQNLHKNPGSLDPTGPAALGNDPRHTFKLRAQYAFSPVVDMNVNFRYVSELSYLTIVPAYNATDVDVRWHVTPKLDLSFGVTDLFHAQHVEFDDNNQLSEIPRTAFVQMRWKY